jgi:hypothetical protein
MPEECSRVGANVYAFYHQQDTETVVAGGPLFIAYGAVEGGDEAEVEVAKSIVDVLRGRGLAAFWDERDRERIQIAMTWQRRALPERWCEPGMNE